MPVNGDDLLNLGALAAATGLTNPTLRHYDVIGLLYPSEVDAGTGYRHYRRDQIGDRHDLRSARRGSAYRRDQAGAGPRSDRGKHPGAGSRGEHAGHQV